MTNLADEKAVSSSKIKTATSPEPKSHQPSLTHTRAIGYRPSIIATVNC